MLFFGFLKEGIILYEGSIFGDCYKDRKCKVEGDIIFDVMMLLLLYGFRFLICYLSLFFFRYGVVSRRVVVVEICL